MADPCIPIAVVGHTNTGKTSLLRTLLKDSGFGEVSHHPGTTRHVEGGELLVNGQAVVQLYDTPGLEDSIGLLDVLETSFSSIDENRDKLQSFLQNLNDYPDYDQEAKVIRQLLGDELILYVIDVREPVLGKYKDELKIISMASRPIIPVLNFISKSSNNLPLWQKTLANLGLHAVVEFDTVVFYFEDEKRLYEKMQALLTRRYDLIQTLMNDRESIWQQQLSAAQRLAAELFVNVASYRESYSTESYSKESHSRGSYARDSDSGQQHSEGLPLLPSKKNELSNFQERVRGAEQQCVKNLFEIFRFSADDLDLEHLPVENGSWSLDLFDPDNLKTFGLDAGSKAATGAALGVGIDAMVGGITLGAAAAIGAVTGFVWATGKRFGREIGAKVRGENYICVDETTLQVLWLRQKALLDALRHRGHAAQEKIMLGKTAQAEMPELWEHWVKKFRAHPEWSVLSSTAATQTQDSARESEIDLIAQSI